MRNTTEKVRSSRPVQAASTALLTLGVVLFGTVPAYAQVVIPTTEESIEAGFGELLALVVGVLAASLFGITVAVLGIRMGIKWLRKGATS